METQGERREERGQKEEADEEDARKRRCTRTRLVCGGNISTEINQGCTQISKRKITKINRPDVQCDKKALPRSSFSHFSLFFLFPLSLSFSLCFFALSFSSFPSPPPPRQGPREDSSVHGHETADCTTELSWGLYQLHRSYP